MGVHLTDGHPDLNYNQVIQWEEGQLIIDGHVICIKIHTAVKTPIACDICLQFTLSRNAQSQNHRVTRQQAKKMIHEHCKLAAHSSCAICFFINTAALSAVNTLCISLFLFIRQCSVAASGACLQSNRRSPLFLCFLSVVIENKGEGCRQQECVVCWWWSLLAHVWAVTFPLNHTISSVKTQRQKWSKIDHNLNKFQFVTII